MTPPARVAFRADASTEIGTGHVMRCLTLANALAERGVMCHFLSRDLPGNLCDRIAASGHRLHRLAAPIGGAVADPEGPAHASWLGLGWHADAADCAPILAAVAPDWLVMDHYALDARWQRAVLPEGCRLLVVDDLADRPHIADVLLDQNLGRRAADYEGLVQSKCKRLVGPSFALLRPEFAAARDRSLVRRRNSQLRRIMVSMGGMDRDGATVAVLDALARSELPDGIAVTVIMGGGAPSLNAVREKVEVTPFPCALLVDRTDMAELLVETDLVIGAAGSSSWERCCLGVPTILLSIADNQEAAAQALHAEGAAIFLGRFQSDAWYDHLSFLFISGDLTRTMPDMSMRSYLCCDGRGAVKITELLWNLS